MATDSYGDYFMWFPTKAETIVSGETTDDTFKKRHACEVESFSFKLSNGRASTDDDGGGSQQGKEKGKLRFGDLTVKKTLDLASVYFYRMCSLGSRIDTVMLAARKSGGGRMLYNQYQLRNVLVKEISWEAASQGVAETLTLSFMYMAFKYNPQDSFGNAVAVNKEWYWDTVTNTTGAEPKFLNPFED